MPALEIEYRDYDAVAEGLNELLADLARGEAEVVGKAREMRDDLASGRRRFEVVADGAVLVSGGLEAGAVVLSSEQGGPRIAIPLDMQPADFVRTWALYVAAAASRARQRKERLRAMPGPFAKSAVPA